MNKLLLFLTAAAALFSACGKDDPDPVDRLPPATQTGANTFGCLVNGQPWTPKGNNGFSNYSVAYDTAPAGGGVLDVRAYRYTGTGANDYEYMILFANQLTGPGLFNFIDSQRTQASFENQRTRCYWSNDDRTTTYRRGQLNITRLDLQAGIVSGTFSFTLYKPGCDSIRVTDGRFDRKL
ncbi:hypothetical protein GCM10023185_12330 [Hymenobacter saemangeumensis]|uniref:Lipoprotein n=1 Tax=Hymenobacter saemangeumensis TaxID=1084522 RepID=A0ABP8I702_9BACT